MILQQAPLAHHLGPLAPYLETYRASGRLVLLLDGLNEMPQADYTERVGHIQDMLDRTRPQWSPAGRWITWSSCDSCRELIFCR